MKMKFDVKGTMKNLGILSEDQAADLNINLELEFAPEEFRDVLKYQLEVLPMIYNAIKDIQKVNEHEAEQAAKIFEQEEKINSLERENSFLRKKGAEKENKKETVPFPYYGNGRPRP
jgi:hypothetical protein|nr:MAG TPA: hypothetical protein [Caudoviricetes sp.]